MMPFLAPRRFALCAALLSAALSAHAEKADRDKPVNLEADRVTVDDINKVHIFDGHVTLSQGTLVIRSDQLVVKQDAEGFKNGTATAGAGRLAHFRVKRDGKDEFIDGEAERIEYDARTEITRFFNRAYVRSGLDEVRGQYILFDGQNEKYSVTSGPDGTVLPGRENRVRAVIQPKNKGREPEPAGTSGPPVKLQIAPGITNPR